MKITQKLRNEIYNYALFMSKNHADAEDITQETFLKAVKFSYKFEEGTNYKAWLVTIARNQFINFYRKRKRQPSKVDTDDALTYYIDKTEYFEPLELKEEIEKSFSILDDKQKTVMSLFIDGYSYADIAHDLSIPKGTVMSRIFRSREKLNEKANAQANAVLI